MAAAAGGGGTGAGGKIRNRRYHLSSQRTPYSKSRQQEQQGIISRVTDTVKSIVPGWLQKYFNKAGEGTGRVHNATGSVEEHTEDREADVDQHIYVDDEAPLATDGRVTPEPIRLDEEEPSTSRSALNVSDVLTRPSLHRANLNFTLFDSPALHCQPSTSSAFPIGSSGFSLVKEIKDSTSQHDDDNISTTSGFSSRASDKDVAVSKNVNAPPLWSPEADRSHSLSHNSSTTSKKPSFNLSAFGALSPSLGNSSVLKSSQLGDSPFYPGKTVYGGAGAARSSRVRSTPYQAPLRLQVKAKSTNSQSYGVTSSTARRILQSLEKMSSPLADAKRIPTISSPLSLTPERSLLDGTEMPSKRKKVDSSYPPVQRLVTPKSISVNANRSLYVKPSLTPSAVANKSSRRVQPDKHKVPRRNHVPDPPAAPLSESFSYPKFSTPASNGLSGGGKMMRERGSHYTTKPADEEPAVPALPEISLPISLAALPTFTFSTLTNTTASPITARKAADSKMQTTSAINSSPVFTFSSPIVKSTDSNAQSTGSPVGFTFSEPAVKASVSSTIVEDKMPALSSPAKTPVTVNSSNAKKKEEETGGFCKPAKSLKEGSVLDMLRSPGFATPLTPQQTSTSTLTKSTPPVAKPAVSSFTLGKVTLGEGNKPAFGLWQCNACLLENRASDSNCVACSAAKEKPAGTPKQQTMSAPSCNTKNMARVSSTQGFGDKFKMAAGTWNCDTCLVQNKAEATKCVACETPKPGTGVKAALLIPPTTKAMKSTAEPSVVPASISLSLQDMFKKPEGAWDCTVCCVQNKTEDSRCVACMSEKPASTAQSSSGQLGLLDQFKTPSGSWNCDVCLIINKAEATKCVACESAKPGTKAELKASTAQSSSGQLGLLDQFKTPSGSWNCDVCLIINKAEATKCVACESAKPGTKAELKGFGTSTTSTGSTAPSFKFGLQSSSGTGDLKLDASTDVVSASNTSASGFSFPKPTGDFKFGIGSSASSSDGEKKDKGFTFGIAAANSNQVSAGFKFGISGPAQTEKDSIKKPVASGFTFGAFSSSASAAPASTETSVLQPPSEKDNSNTANSIGLKDSDGKKSETSPSLSGFSFGKAEQKKEVLSTSFVFGKKDEKTDSTPVGPSLVFGIKKDGEEPKPFVFGKPEQTKEDNSAPAAYAFGVPNPTEKKDADPAAKPVFAFGTQPTTTDTGATTQTFSFLASGSTSVTPSSTPAISSSVFRSAAQSSTASSSSNVFGNASQSSSPAVSSNMFGNSAPSNATAVSSSGFGNVASSSTPAGSSSIFGSAAPSTAPAGSSSVFSNVTQATATAVTSSLFGSTAPSSAPAGASSLFGSAALSNVPTSSSGVFGTVAPLSTPAGSGSVFGSAAATTSTSSNSASIFGSSGADSNPPAGTFVFGQPASTASGSVFGSATESKSTFVFSSQENKPVTSASTAAASPFVFGASAASSTTAAPGFNFGGANTSNVSGTNSTPFVFGAGPAAPTASSLPVAANSVPAFGQNTNQSSTPAFGSSTSTSMFPAVFGQQSTQPAFGSTAAPTSGSGFQFGSSNFNFGSTNSSTGGGVFTFGSNAGGSANSSTQGFAFNSQPTFNMGTNGRSTQASTISNRKIKTARRRK
ncbi:nuclear pore complex protein Nup153 [Rhinophrynus dorsalis]